MRGTEWCIFTLQETIKHRWRKKLNSYVLFIDLKKAYDSLSPSALWRILSTTLGLPEQTINFHRTAYAERITEFTFNGSSVDSWNQQLGVGQGDILSPLLFNLFIDSLSRYLNTPDSLLDGVTVGEGNEDIAITLNHILYADDLAAISGSREGLERLGTRVTQWCAQWAWQSVLEHQKQLI